MYFVMLARRYNSEIFITNVSNVSESVSYFDIKMSSFYIELWKMNISRRNCISLNVIVRVSSF